MPQGREVDSEEEDGIFQSPEWDPTPDTDQGASPQLRRSTRKRKSTAGDDSMTQGNSSKKKKASPNKMPKVTRSPPKAQAAPTPDQAQSFEALLLAMEGRLSAKMEKASEAAKEAAHQAKLNSEGLENLESRVDANENCLMEALRESEARIMNQVQARLNDLVQDQVKGIVEEHLHAAGFDKDLTAADLSVRSSAVKINAPPMSSSYAQIAAVSSGPRPDIPRSRQDKQEDKFLLARRSLRLWPLAGGKKASLDKFLAEKLRLDKPFIQEELGEVKIIKPREPRNKNKDEYIVIFESKQVRDAVKAAAPNLANHREDAGMRLHIPDHLQKDFHALMNLSFDLKKRHPGLKRNIKFDEEDNGLFMDLKLEEGADWKTIKPAQAFRANKKRTGKKHSFEDRELEDLLEEDEGSDNE